MNKFELNALIAECTAYNFKVMLEEKKSLSIEYGFSTKFQIFNLFKFPLHQMIW